VRKGDCQLSQDERKEKVEQKRREIVNYIHKCVHTKSPLFFAFFCSHASFSSPPSQGLLVHTCCLSSQPFFSHAIAWHISMQSLGHFPRQHSSTTREAGTTRSTG
jgi:hypothetical protein